MTTRNDDRTPVAEPRVLLLEDDPILGGLFERCLLRRGCQVRRFTRAEEAEAALLEGVAGALVTDFYLPGNLNGIDLLQRMRARGDDRPAVVITGSRDPEDARAARAAGARALLHKPFSMQALLDAVEALFDESTLTAFEASARN